MKRKLAQLGLYGAAVVVIPVMSACLVWTMLDLVIGPLFVVGALGVLGWIAIQPKQKRKHRTWV
jgi:hypothetical protein